MARIQTYDQDSNVTFQDKLIGTDSASSATKNFTIQSLMDVINQLSGIDLFDGIVFKYQAFEPAAADPAGALNLVGGAAATQAFTATTQIIVSKKVVNGIDVKIINERVQYIDENGEIITRSLLDYTKTNLIKKYKNLNFFLEEWNKAERKKIVTIELEKQGIIFEALNEIVGKNFDPFDLVCHIAFDQKPLTRKERSDKLKKKDYFNKYSANAKLVIDKILDKYCEKGIEEIENPAIITVDPLNKLGTPHEIINHFGDINAFNETIKFISKELYT